MKFSKGMKNIVSSVIGQAVTIIIAIFIPRIVITSYSSEVNGLLNSISQVITYLALLEAGVGAVALQALYKPITTGDKEAINEILSATNKYYKKTGLFYLLSIIVVSFIYPFIINSNLNYFFVAEIVFITSLPNVINFFFQGKLQILIRANGYDYFLTNLSTILGCLASSIKIFLLLNKINVILVQTVYCGISLLQMIAILLFIKKKFPWLDLKVKPNYNAIRQKNSALTHQVCSLVTNSTDITVLSIFCGLEIASIYSIYNMIFNIITNIVDSLNNGFQYKFGKEFCLGMDNYRRFLIIFSTYYFFFGAGLMFACYALSIPFIALYTRGADIQYVDKWLPLLFAFVHVLKFFRNPFLSTCSVAGHFKQTQRDAILESIINLSLSLILVNIIGIYGVLLGTILAVLYRDFAVINYSNRIILNRSGKNIVKIIVIDVIVFIALIVFNNLFVISIDSYLDFFLYAFIITLLSLLLFFVVNLCCSIESLKCLIKIIQNMFKRNEVNQ